MLHNYTVVLRSKEGHHKPKFFRAKAKNISGVFDTMKKVIRNLDDFHIKSITRKPQ